MTWKTLLKRSFLPLNQSPSIKPSMSAEVVGAGAIANPVPPQNGVTGNRGNSRRGRNHNRRTNATATTDHNSENNSNSQDPSASSRGRGGRGRGRGPIGNASNRGAGDNRRGRGRGRGRGAVTTPATSRPESRASNTNGEQEEQVIEPVGSSRRRQFGGKLTIGEGETAASSSTSPNPLTGPKSSKRSDQPQKGKNPQSQATPNSRPPPPKEFTDLRSRLFSELSSGGYECSICYSTITTKQPVWSCNQCWNVLHLNCTKKWASSSVQKMEELNSMQEDPNIRNKPGSWRCPGCQYSREVVPKDYTCWCGRVRDPNGSKGSPHSCSQRCGKSR